MSRLPRHCRAIPASASRSDAGPVSPLAAGRFASVLSGPVLLTGALLIGLTGLPAHAGAQTLREALVTAYQTSPPLNSQRAGLRATDEAVPQALSRWRPTVTVTGQYGYRQTEFSGAPIPTRRLRPDTESLTVTQPIYRGGRTQAQVEQAENQVRAARAQLIAQEQLVLNTVAGSYMDVLRDQATLDLAVNNEQVLRRQLELTQAQFQVGTVTRTDVANAESALASATASRVSAEAGLQADRAGYLVNVGQLPGKLVYPTERPPLPNTRDEAIKLASTQNPNVVAAAYTEAAARASVRLVRGQLLPTLNAQGTVTHNYESSVRDTTTFDATATAQLSIPIYEAGVVYSQTRQAQQNLSLYQHQTDEARREAAEGATLQWNNLTSARAQILSYKASVAAATVALEGIRQEQAVGSRTIVDVLISEQNRFQAEVNLVGAQHDEVVAAYNLATTIGRLTAQDLGLPVQLYDAEKNYREIRDKLVGFGVAQ